MKGVLPVKCSRGAYSAPEPRHSWFKGSSLPSVCGEGLSVEPVTAISLPAGCEPKNEGLLDHWSFCFAVRGGGGGPLMLGL